MRFILFVSLIFPIALFAQNRGDSLLAAERSIDRPITLHKGQLRLTSAYSLAVVSRRYDQSGNANKLSDEGLSSFRHRFGFDIKYGINEFFQFSASISHASQTVRDQTRRIVPISSETEPSISENRLFHYTGVEDIIVGLDARAPLRTKKLDVGMTAAISLPTAKQHPDQPSHSVEFSDENGSPQYDLVYRYNYNLGKGVSVIQLGGMAKYRTPRWAFSARFDYRHGLEEGSGYAWEHQLVDYEKFEYRKEVFSYRLPDTFDYYAEVEYQALPWFDLIFNVSGYYAQNGWQSTGPYKLGIPAAKLVVLNPGVELIVTPRLWFRQELQIPVYGESVEGAFIFYTSLLYNFFLR